MSSYLLTFVYDVDHPDVLFPHPSHLRAPFSYKSVIPKTSTYSPHCIYSLSLHISSPSNSVIRVFLVFSQICHLDVSGNNKIPSSGWSIIGDIVKNNKVQELDLSCCGLTYDKLKKFYESLEDCEVSRQLSLYLKYHL